MSKDIAVLFRSTHVKRDGDLLRMRAAISANFRWSVRSNSQGFSDVQVSLKIIYRILNYFVNVTDSRSHILLDIRNIYCQIYTKLYNSNLKQKTACFHIFSYFRYQGWDGILKHPITNETYEANHVNTSQGLLDSFADETFVYKWKVCCMEAINCCHRMIEKPPPSDKGKLKQ